MEWKGLEKVMSKLVCYYKVIDEWERNGRDGDSMAYAVMLGRVPKEVNMCVLACVCMCKYLCLYVYAFVCTYVNACVCICVCMCWYVCRVSE